MAYPLPSDCPATSYYSKKSYGNAIGIRVRRSPLSLMASTTFSLADALQSLDAEGFVAFEDAGVGGEVAEMERRDFALLSPYGLDYYQRHILNDTVGSVPV